MTDRKKEKGGKVNLLDLVMLFLLILSVLMIPLRWKTQRELPIGTQPYIVTLRNTSVHPQIAQCLTVGEWVYDSQGETVGELLNVLNSEASMILTDGKALISAAPKEYAPVSLEIRIRVLGTTEGGMLMIGGKRMLPIGEEVQLYTKKTGLNYQVVGVDPVSNEMS